MPVNYNLRFYCNFICVLWTLVELLLCVSIMNVSYGVVLFVNYELQSYFSFSLCMTNVPHLLIKLEHSC